MKNSFRNRLSAPWLWLGTPAALGFLIAAGAQEARPEPAPDYAEVIAAIQESELGLAPAELEQAALEGVFSAFQSQIQLLAPATETDDAPLALTRFYEPAVGYISAPLFNASAVEVLREAYNRLDSAHVLRGLIIDLRHVSGDHYAAIPHLIGLFTQNEIPLLDWGEGLQTSRPQDLQVKQPLIVIVDATTRRAAEAFAAVVRRARLGLIVGRPTAGQAQSYRTFTLQTGHRLRTFTGRVKLADDTPLDDDGVTPDILTAERPAANLSPSQPEPQPEGALPLPADDPVLARAIEILKGIEIVKKRQRS